MKTLKDYNVYIFNDGDVLASTKSINYFRDDVGAKLIASGLSRDDAWNIEYMLRDKALYKVINDLVSEIDTLNMQVEMLENVIA